jgi:excisionase family DNA binding protein
MCSTETNAMEREIPAIQPITVGAKDAAAMTGLSRATIWNMIKDGRLSSVRIGRRTLVRVSSIEALLEQAA